MTSGMVIGSFRSCDRMVPGVRLAEPAALTVVFEKPACGVGSLAPGDNGVMVRAAKVRRGPRPTAAHGGRERDGARARRTRGVVGPYRWGGGDGAGNVRFVSSHRPGVHGSVHFTGRLPLRSRDRASTMGVGDSSHPAPTPQVLERLPGAA